MQNIELTDKRILISSLLLFYSIFFNIGGGMEAIIGQTKNLSVFIFILYNFNIYKKIFYNDFKYINVSLLLFIFVIIISSIINQDIVAGIANDADESSPLYSTNAKRVDHTIYMCISMISTILFFEEVSRYEKSKNLAVCLFKIFLIYAFFVYYDVFTTGFHNSTNLYDDVNYIIGNKFAVSYYSLYLIVLYYMSHYDKLGKYSITPMLLFGFSVFIAFYVNCKTSLMATVCLFLLCVLYHNHNGYLKKGTTFALFLTISTCSLLFFSDYILSLKPLEYIIVDLLGKDITLSHRVGIYGAIFEVVDRSPLVGFGIGNFYSVCAVLIGAPNAQNGIVNLFIEVGILGAVLFLLWQFLMLNKYNQNEGAAHIAYPILAFLYVMAFIASVEIPYDTYYFFFSSLLLVGAYDKNCEI